jgi:hypothetical protein
MSVLIMRAGRGNPRFSHGCGSSGGGRKGSNPFWPDGYAKTIRSRDELVSIMRKVTTGAAKDASTVPASILRISGKALMPVLDRIAHFQNRRDEAPNQELARDLVAAGDEAGVREIAENIGNRNAAVQRDCIKVLYEIGCLNPSLIAMIALSTVAELKPDEIFAHHEEIENLMRSGSVITVDNGVKTLAAVASRKDAYRKELIPFLFDHLKVCRSKDVPQHSEKIAVAIDGENRQKFVDILNDRLPEMTASQGARIRRVIREAGNR